MVSDDERLSIVRHAFARQILAVAGVPDCPALEAAFASVARESFIGPPPWQIVTRQGYRTLASNDLVVAYQDINFALSPGRGVNNGSPLLHAMWLHALGPIAGARVAHIGAGTGYYTAILSHLVGERGQVLAIEHDSELVERAERNLAGYGNVALVHADGATLDLGTVDAIYVNFAVGRPADRWIDALRPGGRLIFPLGQPGQRRGTSGGRHAAGGGFRIERVANGFAAAWLGPAFFVCADGILAPSQSDKQALHSAFEAGGMEFIRCLRWRTPAVPDRSWFIGTGWSLGYDAPAG